MADEQSNSADESETAHEPRECMPCRGSGRVISNLGGSPSEVTCPWCRGGGVRLAGLDTQASWLAERAESEGSESHPEPAA